MRNPIMEIIKPTGEIMKSLSSLILFFILLIPGTVFSQSAGDYQSKTSGNWGDATSWQTFDGSVWNDAVSAPAGTSGTITIQSGHTITVAAAITINGAAVVVNGYLKNSLSVTASSSVAAFTFGNGSTYEHAINGGTIPLSVWGDGSTCLITGTGATAPSAPASGTSYFNYTWNCAAQSTSLNTGWDNVTVRGSVTILNSNSFQWRMTSSGTRIITIMGDVVVSGASSYLTTSGSSGSSSTTYNVAVFGKIKILGGKLNLTNGSGGTSKWTFCGDSMIIASGAQFANPSNSLSGTRLVFAKKNGTQYYSNAGTNSAFSYGVDSNATVMLNSPLSVGSSSTPGYLILNSGKFVTSSTNTLTLTAGSQDSSFGGYVEGPLSAVIASTSQTTKALYIGKGGVYRPTILTVTQDAATSTTYTAELINSTPAANTLPAALDGVSASRYIHLVKGSGANVTNATIQLTYDTNDGVDVSNKDNLRIAKDNGAGNWVSLGGSGSANNTGNISSSIFGTTTAYGTLTTNDYVIAHANPAYVPTIPVLTTNAISNISTTFATSGGVISSDGDAPITAKGVCWNTSTGPTTANSKTSDGNLSTPFTSSITGLSAGVTYYVRAYAVNSAGTGYGNEDTLTTLSSLSAPTISTNAVTNIVNTTATGNGNITAWGGSAITDRGVAWSTSHNPTTADNFNSVGAGGTGAFTTPIGGLTLGTTYYVCAYATNTTGTSYGNEVSFTTPSPQPDVNKIVDSHGTPGVDCDYTTITDAFNAVPSNYTGHWFIYVKNGTYYEKPLLAAGKINVVLVGQDKDNTILTYDDYAGNNRTTNGVTSSGTNTSYSVAIDAADFQAQNITFQNTATFNSQAVALRTNGDRQSYYNCKMIGRQDTYYTQGGTGTGPDRLYHKNCYIEGSVDFIFGRDVALFDSCTLYCNRQGGTLTAASTEAGYTYGYVFLNCTIGSLALNAIGFDGNAMISFYLGRPWQASPKTVFINCYEPATLNLAGWTTMGPSPSLYSEYGCTGPGAASRAVNTNWTTSQPSTISAGQAANYTIANIFSKSNAGPGFSYAANWTPSQISVNMTLLPVELTTFTATSDRLTAMLEWATATEKANYGFDVERSAQQDSKKESVWMKVDFVQGSGTSNAPHRYSFEDTKLTPGKYSYRLKQIDQSGSFKYSQSVDVEVGTAPRKFTLSENYPNPFNPTTNIEFTVRDNGPATLKVYNIAGQVVAELFNGQAEAGKIYLETFNASRFASGIYFTVLQMGSQRLIHKMSLLK